MRQAKNTTDFARGTRRVIIAAALLCSAAVQAQAPAPVQRPRNGFALKVPSTAEEIAAAKPNPQAPGFRIPFPPLEQMDPAQRTQFESLANTFHTSVGNRAPLLLTPDVDAANNVMLPALSKTAIPQDLWELTILMVAREWAAQLEWWIHAPQAPSEGIPADAVEAIRLGKTPKFATPGQDATYHYMAELLRDHNVTDATYERLRAIVGTRQMVEMTVLAGYYASAAMTIVAHRVPLRPGEKLPLVPLAVTFPK